MGFKNQGKGELEGYIDVFMELFPEMLKKYEGKWTVIKGKVPLGFFDTEGNAYEKGVGKYGNVPMLVRQVSREYLEHGKYGKPLVFHSKVSFV